jgi:hypothetical protein
MSTSLISTRDLVKSEEGAEKSISTRFRAKEAENAENRAECPPNDLQKELILVQHQAFLSQLYYGKVPTITTIPRLSFGTFIVPRKSGLVRISCDVPWNRYR